MLVGGLYEKAVFFVDKMFFIGAAEIAVSRWPGIKVLVYENGYFPYRAIFYGIVESLKGFVI